MARIIGVKEVCDIAGLDVDNGNDVKRVVDWLRRNKVPYVGIGRNQRGNKRGILIDEDALVVIIQAKARKDGGVARAKRPDKRQLPLDGKAADGKAAGGKAAKSAKVAAG